MNHALNARRLLCPLPVIRTQEALENLQVGDKLTVFCTDPGALNDIPAWTKVHNHILIDKYEKDYEYIITIQKN